MASFIITLVAIALVAALAAATLYYGGSTFASSRDKVAAARMVNEGNQVRAAASLFVSIEKRKPLTLEELVAADYLKNNLDSAGWVSLSGTAQLTDVSSEQCAVINKLLGISGVPSCDDPRYLQRPTCCDATAATGSTGSTK